MKDPKIPVGWRRLRKGTLIREGDMFFDYGSDWMPTGDYFGGKACNLIYIRRIPRKRKG